MGFGGAATLKGGRNFLLPTHRGLIGLTGKDVWEVWLLFLIVDVDERSAANGVGDRAKETIFVQVSINSTAKTVV